MAITRKVDTDVYCDICGKWVTGWRSDNDGVSRAWAVLSMRERKDAQLERKSSVKSAG